MSIKSIYLLLLVLIFTALLAEAAQFPKVDSYAIKADFVLEESAIKAVAEIRFADQVASDDSLCFFLHGELWVDSIKQVGQQMDFKQQKVFYYYDYSLIADRVTIPVQQNQNLSGLQIYYSGKFNPSNARTPSDYMRIDENGVFLRAFGYSLWFPVFLEPGKQSYAVDFSEAVFSNPPEYRCVFAGNLIRESAENGKFVSVWSAKDIDLIDAQCSVQKWEVLSDDWLRIYHWKDSLSSAKAREILDFSTSFNRACDRRFRKNMLPEQGYIIEMPNFGDISSANVTGISDRLWITFGDEQHSLETFAHEIVHPYVQIPIDARDPLYAIVIEGFPNYFDAVVLSDYLGHEWLESLLKTLEKSYLQKKASGLDDHGRPLPADKPLDQISADDIGRYKDKFILTSRTSLFFNYLKYKMGENKYTKFERQLFDCDSISLEKFKTIILKYLPDSEDDLNIWLSSTEYPERFHLQNLK